MSVNNTNSLEMRNAATDTESVTEYASEDEDGDDLEATGTEGGSEEEDEGTTAGDFSDEESDKIATETDPLLSNSSNSINGSEPIEHDHHEQKRMSALHLVLSWNRWVDQCLQWLFFRWAKIVAKMPIMLIIIALILYTGLSLGMLVNNNEEDDADLWLSSDSNYVEDENYRNKHFGEHEEQIIVTPKHPDDYGDDLLSNVTINVTVASREGYRDYKPRTYLEEMLRLYETVLNVTVLHEGRNYTLSDLCVYANPNATVQPKVCVLFSVLDYWRFNETRIREDTDPHATVSASLNTSFGQPMPRNLVLGGIQLSPNRHNVTKAKAFKVLFYLRNPDNDDDDDNDDNERHHYAHYRNSRSVRPGDGGNIPRAPTGLDREQQAATAKAKLKAVHWSEVLLKWEDALVDALDKFEDNSPLLAIDQMLQSATEELLREVDRDKQYLYISLGVMFAFLFLFLYSFDCVVSKLLVALCGSIHMVTAGLATTGVCGYLAIPNTPLTQTLYFLIMAVGIPHILLLLHAYERSLSLALEASETSKGALRVDETRCLGQAMARALPSITVETLAETVAFLAISLSEDAGFRAFGQQAGLSVLLQYLLLLSFFSACIVLDSRRIANYRADLLPCLTCRPDVDEIDDVPYIASPANEDLSEEGGTPSHSEDQQEIAGTDDQQPSQQDPPLQQLRMYESGAFGRKRGTLLGTIITRAYAPILVRLPVKVVVILCLLGLLGFGIYGVHISKQEFDRKNLYSRHSAQHQFLEVDEEMFAKTGEAPLQVIVRTEDYASPAVGGQLQALVAHLKSSKYVYKDSFLDWYTGFLHFLEANGYVNSTNHFPPADCFYDYLQAFLCKDKVGIYFQGDILFTASFCNETSTLATPGCSSTTSPLVAESPRAPSPTIIASRFRPFTVYTQHLQDQVDMIEALYGVTENSGLDCFPFGNNYAFYMTFPEMLSGSHMYLILASVAVFACTFLSIDGVSCLLVMAVFACVYVELVGIVMNYSIPSIAMSQLSLASFVIATALSVNYSIHILHEFMVTPGSRKERVIHALSTAGYSTTCGFLCVFLGSFVGLFVESTLFSTFIQMFLSSAVLAFGHGFALVPVILSICGVKAYIA